MERLPVKKAGSAFLKVNFEINMNRKRRIRYSHIEPDVLNTEFMFLALNDDFKMAAEKAGFKTFQDILNKKKKVLNGSVFTAAQETEMLEYAEYHNFIHLFELQ